MESNNIDFKEIAKKHEDTIEAKKTEVCEAGKLLITKGLVAGTWGNISSRVSEDLMIITPSGVKYDEAEPNDMVLVQISTGNYLGHKPSTEVKLHIKIYENRDDVNAIIHTHSMNASTVAAARRTVPPILDDMAQIIGPTIRVAKYALPGTKKLVKKTYQALKGRNAVLLANHGALCVGRDMDETFVVCEVLEKACKSFIEAEFLGGAKSINRVEAWIMHQYYLKKYAKK